MQIKLRNNENNARALAYIKKKQYLCTRLRFVLRDSRFHRSMTTRQTLRSPQGLKSSGTPKKNNINKINYKYRV